jgi:hypothetical protein
VIRGFGGKTFVIRLYFSASGWLFKGLMIIAAVE